MPGKEVSTSASITCNRPGLTTDERERLKQPERENFELKRAPEKAQALSSFHVAHDRWPPSRIVHRAFA